MRKRGVRPSSARSRAMAWALPAPGWPKRRKKERKSAQVRPTPALSARLRKRRLRISAMETSLESRAFILRAGQDRADEALQLEAARVDLVPEPLVDLTLVRLVAHLPPEVPDEVGVDHGADEALGLFGPLGEGLHALAAIRIGDHH